MSGRARCRRHIASCSIDPPNDLISRVEQSCYHHAIVIFFEAFISQGWRRPVKSKLSNAILVFACLLLVSSPISAHHGTSGYDMERVITLNGTVTSFNWSNPHCLVHIDVKDNKSEIKDWIVELAAPTIMTRSGWAKDSLKPGDEVIAETHPAKNGATTGLSASSTVLLKFVVNGHALPFR
jgi:hypothetical protein